MNKIEIKNENTRWVALDIADSSVISEGVTPEEATEKAEEISNNSYILMFVPERGVTHIF